MRLNSLLCLGEEDARWIEEFAPADFRVLGNWRNPSHLEQSDRSGGTKNQSQIGQGC